MYRIAKRYYQSLQETEGATADYRELNARLGARSLQR